MILPIFLTNQYLSIEHGKSPKLIRLTPVIDPFTPLVSNVRIREIIKDSYPDIELESDDFSPVITSIASENYDVELFSSISEILDEIPFPVILPESYYDKAIDLLTPAAANEFLNVQKYGLDIPEDIRIQIDSIAISLYVKENIGKFISQGEIIISTAGINSKFITEYTEAMIKALSDNIQIAGVWKIVIDPNYSLMPKIVKAVEEDTPLEDIFGDYLEFSNGKLIIAPGITEIEVGEDDNFETVAVSADHLNKFKIKEDDKIIFKWKSDKSKFEGEIYGSKTGIRVDVRERVKQR